MYKIYYIQYLYKFKVEKVDINTGEKLVLSPMQIARAHMAAVFIDEYVYVPGGTTEEKRELPPIASMERYK